MNKYDRLKARKYLAVDLASFAGMGEESKHRFVRFSDLSKNGGFREATDRFVADLNLEWPQSEKVWFSIHDRLFELAWPII